MKLKMSNGNKSLSISDWDARMKDVLIGIPGAKYKIATNSYEFPLSWGTILALQNGIYGTNVELDKDVKKWVKEYYNSFVKPGYEKRAVLDPDVTYLDSLFRHQNADVDFILSQKRCIIANGMGSGKTRSPIATYKVLKERGEMDKPMLWVGPSSTKSGVLKDIRAVDPTLDAVIVAGTSTQRKKILKEKHDIYIMNYEQLEYHSRLAPYGSEALKKCPECGGTDGYKPVTQARCQTHLKELNEIDFGFVVADEAHRIINPKNLSTRALKYATGDAEYRVAMSGTPISKVQSDMWSILNFLYPEEFPSRTKFFDYYFMMGENPFSGGREPRGLLPHRAKDFYQLIDPIMRRIPTEAVIDFLPPLLRSRREVEPDAKQRKAYNQMRDEMLVELESGVLMADSVLPKMTRLLQLASSYADVEYTNYVDPETLETVTKQVAKLKKPSSKIKAFISDMGDFGDDQLVVFTVSSQLANLLSEELQEHEKKASRDNKWRYSHTMITGQQSEKQKAHAIDTFQEGRVSIAIVTTGAGGTGVTLTKANTMVFLQRPWSMIESQQAEARAYRIGSEIHDSVNIIDYVWSGSVEEQVFKALDNKSQNLEAVLQDKELLKKWLKNGEI